MAKNEVKPKWKLGPTLRDGEALLAYALEHKARLEPRLEAGLFDGMRASLMALGSQAIGISSVRDTKKAARRTQDQAVEQGSDLVSVCREAIRRKFKNKSVQKDFGVGTRVSMTVGSVASALTTVEQGFMKRPDEARRAGLASEELEEVQSLLNDLLGADDVQEASVETSRTATEKRNAEQARLERAMEDLVGVAVVVFRKEPAIAERFRGYLPTKARSGAKKKVTV